MQNQLWGKKKLIPIKLRIELIVLLIIYFSIILILLKNKKISLKYTLLWLLTGVVFLILVLVPGILSGLCVLLGVQSTMNMLYLFLLGFMIMIMMSITSIISSQNRKIRRLTEENALLEERIRTIEDYTSSSEIDRSDCVKSISTDDNI